MPEPWFLELAGCFEKAFGRAPALNEPFRGGYIVRAHAAELPWVMIELSRAPFLPVAEKRACVRQALASFCEAHGFEKEAALFRASRDRLKAGGSP